MDGTYTLQQLGQKVKAKYPQYANLPDEEVGQKVAQKYPQYQKNLTNDTPQAPQPEGKSVGGFVGNVFKSGGEAIKDIGSAVVNTVNPDPRKNTLVNIADLGGDAIESIPVVGKTLRGAYDKTGPGMSARLDQSGDNKAAALVDMYKGRYGGTENIKNTLYNDPIGALLDISTVLTGGGAAASKVGTVSKISKLAKAGEIAAKTGEIIDPIQATLKATGKVGSVINKTGSKVADVAETEAKNIPMQGVRVTPTQMQKFEKETGISMPDFIKKEGLTGDPVELGKQKVEALQQTYDDAVLRSGKTITKDELRSVFDKQIKELTSGDNAFIEDAGNVAQKIAQRRDFMLNAFGDQKEIPLEKLVAIRRQTDQLIPKNQFNTDPISASVDTQTRRILNDAVYEKLGDEGAAKAMGKQLNKFYKFNEYVSKTNLPSGRSRLLNTMRSAAGGAAIANPALLPAVIASFLGTKVLENPRVLAGASTTLEKGVQGASKVGGAVSDKLSAMQRMLEELNRKGRQTGTREVLRNSNR